MSINLSQRAGWPTELRAEMTTSSVVEIGSLAYSPVIMIMENQGTADIAISVNDSSGDNVWKTFVAGEKIELNMRCQQGKAPNFTADIGTTFYGAGTTGDYFSIAYIYALDS